MERGIRTSGQLWPTNLQSALTRMDTKPISQLMFNTMTFYFTDDPDWKPRDCVVQGEGDHYEIVNTWAPYLVGFSVYAEFQKYEIELRSLVARCMADNPADRPTLGELIETIEENMRRGDEDADEEFRRWEEIRRIDPRAQKPPVDVRRPPAAETNDLLKRWAQEYIYQPINRQDPYEDLWNTSV
ncbi:uncharacterized protein F4807DRAFT_403970 [Annulohypoxylon truncatum]|uniref:uncharacterized protein n=1 Tax=Annulohypoxylon truncatum TaxID=327061 RepID=UPI0020082257|nr:uncharacterized protein F4807DRAFT_403970 [Annulohypoxylon truncatum]KAI1214611.1 hypothetical protein F4807DRAFT_403970 [Annulohypoxylon truncatum]